MPSHSVISYVHHFPSAALHHSSLGLMSLMLIVYITYIYIYYVCLTLCLIIAHSHHQIPKKPTSHSFQNFHRKRTTSCSLPCTPRSYGTSLPNLLQNLPFFVFACLIQLPLPLHLMMNMHFCSQAKARVRTPAPKTQRGMFGVEFGICRMFGCKL